MPQRPGGELARRPLHFIWIADCSDSMDRKGKIQALNTAIKASLPVMKEAADEHPNADVLVRAVRFSDTAHWHVARPTPIHDFKWLDLTADGETQMGKALSLVAEQLKMPPMEDRALPPVLVLVSDGQPTSVGDFETGLENLLREPWGKKAVRVAIAIGDDADVDVLKKFSHPEIPVLEAHNAEQLTRYVKWATTVVLGAVARPASQAKEGMGGGAVPIPAAPEVEEGTVEDGDDVW